MIAQTKKEPINEYQKSQLIRLVDVFIIAPVLIYAGANNNIPLWLRYSLITIGVSTAFYNGKNYYTNKTNEKKVSTI